MDPVDNSEGSHGARLPRTHGIPELAAVAAPVAADQQPRDVDAVVLLGGHAVQSRGGGSRSTGAPLHAAGPAAQVAQQRRDGGGGGRIHIGDSSGRIAEVHRPRRRVRTGRRAHGRGAANGRRRSVPVRGRSGEPVALGAQGLVGRGAASCRTATVEPEATDGHGAKLWHPPCSVFRLMEASSEIAAWCLQRVSFELPAITGCRHICQHANVGALGVGPDI
mmetsp:Transcript_1434/g.5160  ORF Transcript_1434/g.5160 Transcript_1434/m.5160 type:complete len:221 (+) Transcript_1434:1315-1977(+)